MHHNRDDLPRLGTWDLDSRHYRDDIKRLTFSYKKRVNAGRWVDAAKRVGIAPGQLDRVAQALEDGKPPGKNKAARFIIENVDMIRAEAREREKTLYGEQESRQTQMKDASPAASGPAVDLGNDGLPDWVTSNPSRHELVGLGRLLRLVVRDPKTGKREAFEPETLRFLAWDLRRGDLAVAHPTAQGRIATPGQAVAAAHARFHGSDPRGSVAVEIPARGKRVRRLGLLESLTYQPIGWPSNKARNPWMHQFGDVGERGHGKADPDAVSPYPEGLMPWACVDASGALFIERRPGNQYEVTDWIMA